LTVFLVWLGAVTTIAMSQSCSRDCTVIGCPPGAVLHYDLTANVEQLRASQITICHNRECLSRSLSGLSDPSEGIGVGVVLPADLTTVDQTMSPHANAIFWLNTGGKLSVSVDWVPWSVVDLKAGDVYRVEITGAGGEALLRLTETADRYVETYPNGKDCDNNPCRSVVFDRRAP
jgi:hypothetical protein